MRTVSIFKNGKNQAVRLPADMAYEGVGELEIFAGGGRDYSSSCKAILGVSSRFSM